MSEVYRFRREMLPDWLVWELEHRGLIEFDLESLTREQNRILSLLLNLYDMVREGLVEVVFDGKSEPKYRISEKGRKMIGEDEHVFRKR